MKNEVLKKKLSVSLFSQSAGKLFSLCLSILIGGLTARYLGPAQLGNISFAYSLTAMLAPLGNLGVRASLLVRLCEGGYPKNIFATAFWIEVLLSSSLTFLLLPLAVLIGGRPAMPFVMVAIIFNVFLQLAELLEAELFSRNEGMVIASSSVKQSLGGAFATLLALSFKAPVIVFAGLTGFQSLLRLTFLKKHVPLKAYLRFPPSLLSAKQLIVKGLPVMGSNLLFVAYLRSDQIMLEWLRGSAELGIYSVAIKVSECFYFFPFILAQTFMPYLKSRKNKEAQSVGAINLESVKLLNKLSWLSGLLISVLIAFVVPQLIIPIFGDKFLDSANVLIWLAPLGFAMSATYASDSWLQISGFQNHLFFRGVFGASTNIILNLALIPEYGVYGAAFSTSISHLASIFIPGLLVKGTRQNTVQLLFPF